MIHRAGGFAWLLLAGVGCQAFGLPDAVLRSAAPPCGTGATTLCQARSGGTAAAPAARRDDTEHHLTLAASQLEKGDEAGACAHLGVYLAAHPEHTAVRVHFAELLLRQHRTEAAREQFEIFEVKSQEERNVPVHQRIRCESRLARIAEQEEDEYEERLHRGIGLYLLATEQLAAPNSDSQLSAEGVLFRAVTELREAHRLRPGEARPNWYLYRVWTSLSQRRPALRRLKAADSAAAFTYLTPAEQRDLQLACVRARCSP